MRCDVGYNETTSKCLRVFPGPANWLVALISCVTDGGNLASIETQDEQDTVSKMAEVTGTWIGLNDILSEGTPAWADGAAVRFTNWRNNQPNNGGTGQHCVWIRGTDAGNAAGKWDDIRCNKMNAYACQKSFN